MLIPESSSEIISSGVTPTCCPNRTNFPTARLKRSASLSSKSSERLRSVGCGGCVAIGHPLWMEDSISEASTWRCDEHHKQTLRHNEM